MMLLQMHDYSPEAKAYWWTTAVLGLVALSIALSTIAGFDRGAILQIVRQDRQGRHHRYDGTPDPAVNAAPGPVTRGRR